MSSLTWLHISDWHQTASDFDRRLVAKRLLEDIQNRTAISRDLEKIDLIIFSGDVANTGKAAEYEMAVQQLFKPLMKCAGLGDNGWSRILIVPGNHDLDRLQRNAIPEKLIASLMDPSNPAKKRKAVNGYLEDALTRRVLLSPFANFSELLFHRVGATPRYLQHSEPEYFQTRIFNEGGRSIGLAGFNSAWMCGINMDSRGKANDYGNLIIGEPPIDSALDQIGSADIRIAVMHHPLSWLVDFDRDFVEEQFYDKCHFVLHGHQHLPRVHVIGSTIGETVNIPAGTIYNRRFESNPRYANSYNFVHLDFKTSRGTVFLRRWSESANRWINDDAYRQVGGKFQFAIPKEM